MESIFKDPKGNAHLYDKPLMGTAYGESLYKYVAPQSLYMQQLRDRLGDQAVDNTESYILPEDYVKVFGLDDLKPMQAQ
jgi:hypothetical protein